MIDDGFRPVDNLVELLCLLDDTERQIRAFVSKQQRVHALEGQIDFLEKGRAALKIAKRRKRYIAFVVTGGGCIGVGIGFRQCFSAQAVDIVFGKGLLDGLDEIIRYLGVIIEKGDDFAFGDAGADISTFGKIKVHRALDILVSQVFDSLIICPPVVNDDGFVRIIRLKMQ